MASPISYPAVNDNDLDDDALWAVIDSAAASHSASKPRNHPAIKYHQNVRSSSLISDPSPPVPPKLFKNARTSYSADPDSKAALEVEVLQESWNFRPPRKVPSTYSPQATVCSPLAMVRNNVQRTPNAPVYSSPEAFLSPEIARFNGLDRSPASYERNVDKENAWHSLSGRFPSVSLFKEYQNAAMAILEKSDYVMIKGNPFIKKAGWRKISFYFNLSFEIKDKNIEFDENRNVRRAEFVVRAYMQGGRFSDGWGSCDKGEKGFSKGISKPNHDIPSIAETRAKNKASQDLLGIGEYRPGAGQFH